MTDTTLPNPKTEAEKPPEHSWRYFWSMIRYSPALYAGMLILRIFIFGVVPQLSGLCPARVLQHA